MTNDAAEELHTLSRSLQLAAVDLASYPSLSSFKSELTSLAHDLLLPPIAVVVGGFNAGKSTLLNAVLRRELLRMHILPATAAVTMLRSGNEGQFLCHGVDGDVQEFPLARLEVISAEGDSEATEFRNGLSFVEVPLSVPLLRDITLVDTPGLNSRHEAHTNATELFMSRAQAVIWIISCLQPLNEQERSSIDGLPKEIKVLVVINQIDQLDPEEAPPSSVVARVRNNLQRHDLEIVAVSAKLALECAVRADPAVCDASRIDTFNDSLQRHIVAGAKQAQAVQALTRIDCLFESLAGEVERLAANAGRARLRASDSESYHEILKQKLRCLSDAERALRECGDIRAPIMNSAIGSEWRRAKELQLKQGVLRSSLKALKAEQENLDAQFIDLGSRVRDLQDEQSTWERAAHEYMHSGLFGNEPLIFKGKKKELERWRGRLDHRQSQLIGDRQTALDRRTALQCQGKRIDKDCGDFIDDVVAAIRETMGSVVDESRNRIEHQKQAVSELQSLNWLQSFATRVLESSCWGLHANAHADHPTQGGSGVSTPGFFRLTAVAEKIRSDSWDVVVPQPLLEPSRVGKRGFDESTRTGLSFASHFESAGIRSGLKKVGIVLAIAMACCLILLVSLSRGRDLGASTSSANASKFATANIARPVPGPQDDISLIRQALQVKGYSPVGAISDVPGVPIGTMLHVEAVSCDSENIACRKLFVFHGAKAVWSEDLDASTSIPEVQVEGAGLFRVLYTSLVSNGEQIPTSAEYRWDGASLTKAVAAGDLTNSTASGIQPSADASTPSTTVEPSPESTPAAQTSAAGDQTSATNQGYRQEQSFTSTGGAPYTPPSAKEMPGQAESGEAATQNEQLKVFLQKWTSALLSNNAELIAPCYARLVSRYFLQSNWTNDQIKAYLNRTLPSHPVLGLSIRTATVEARGPNWVLLNLDEALTSNNGRVVLTKIFRAQLILQQEDGQWVIGSERDFQ